MAGCSRAPDASENLSDPFVAARLRENTRARELLLTQPTTQPLVRDYGLAVIDGINDANDVAGARLRLQAMAADHANPLAPWAALTLVRMDHVPSTAQIAVNYPAVRSGYDKVVHDFAGTPAADEAFVYESALWLTEKNNDDVAAALQSVNDYLTARPDSLYKSALLMVRSKMQIRLKRYDDALASAIASFDSREVDPTGLASNLANEMFNIGVMAQFRRRRLCNGPEILQAVRRPISHGSAAISGQAVPDGNDGP